MEDYNIFERAIIAAKSIKHSLFYMLDTVRPKILVRKPLTAYKPMRILGKKGEGCITDVAARRTT